MTYEEAFNIIVKYGFCGDCRWRYEDKHCVEYDCYKGVQLIKEALKKQIPKKPKGTQIPICGVCNGIMDLMQGELNYCPNCGQKIDWRDEEDD